MEKIVIPDEGGNVMLVMSAPLESGGREFDGWTLYEITDEQAIFYKCIYGKLVKWGDEEDE